jgi:hypothetical protein
MQDPKDPEKRIAFIEQEIAALQLETMQIIAGYAKRLHQSRRKDARLRGFFLLMSLLFGLLAWRCYADPVGFIPGAWVACTSASLTFLAMAVIFVVAEKLSQISYTRKLKDSTHARTQV